MKNKHEINGYIYVTSEEKPIRDEYYVGFYKKSIFVKKRTSGILIANPCKKIILCNNPNLPIQQLTEQEFEYLKSVDTFEVEEHEKFTFDNPSIIFYKILIPQDTEKERGITITNVSEQPKESIEEVAEKKYPLTNILHLQLNTSIRTGFIEGYNHAKQTLYTEDEVINAFNEGQALNIRGKLINGKEWFNKHKKQ